jgi:hypothetical protein
MTANFRTELLPSIEMTGLTAGAARILNRAKEKAI